MKKQPTGRSMLIVDSNASVINALNCWFGMPRASDSENRLAQLGSGIYYQHIKAEKQENQLVLV